MPSFPPIDTLSKPVREALERIGDRDSMRLAAARCARSALSMCGDTEPRLVEAIAIGEKYAHGEVEWKDLSKAQLALSPVLEERRTRFSSTPKSDPRYREVYSSFEAATCAAACLEANGQDAIAKAAADYQAVARQVAGKIVSRWFIEAGDTILKLKDASTDIRDINRGLGWLPEDLLIRISQSDSRSQRRFAVHCAKNALELTEGMPSDTAKILAICEAMARGDASSPQVEESRKEAERVMNEILSLDNGDRSRATVIGILKNSLDNSAEWAAIRCAEGLNTLMTVNEFDKAAEVVASTIRETS